MEKNGTSKISGGVKLSELLKRTELNYEILKKIDKNRVELPDDVKEEVEIMVKYEGYIKMQETQVEGFTKLDLMEMTRKHICSHKDRKENI